MKSFFKFLFGLLVLLALFAIIGRIFFFDLAFTYSYSMVPNIVSEDLLLIRRNAIMGMGDIAVCHDPENPSQLVVLRILGIPGSKIGFGRNHPRIDGEMIQHAMLDPLIYVDNTSQENLRYAVKIAEETLDGSAYRVSLMDRSSSRDGQDIIVPNGSFFLVADNRNMGRDSRNFGTVPIDNCIGRAIMVLVPGPSSGDLLRSDRFLEFL